jgi:hypothetical protein
VGTISEHEFGAGRPGGGRALTGGETKALPGNGEGQEEGEGEGDGGGAGQGQGEEGGEGAAGGDREEAASPPSQRSPYVSRYLSKQVWRPLFANLAPPYSLIQSVSQSRAFSLTFSHVRGCLLRVFLSF